MSRVVNRAWRAETMMPFATIEQTDRDGRATGERKGSVKGREKRGEEAGHGLSEQSLGLGDSLLEKSSIWH